MSVYLERMTSAAFQRYVNGAIRNYANEHVKSGNWNQDDAIHRATQAFTDLLPEKEATKNNYLFTICHADEEIGMLWFARRTSKQGFIYDINIWEDYQGKGYGKQAMQELEAFAKKRGIAEIRLHVFGHNQVARHVYKELGFIETSIQMKKTI